MRKRHITALTSTLLGLMAVAGCNTSSIQTFEYNPNAKAQEAAVLTVQVLEVEMGKNLSMSMVGPNSHFTGKVLASAGMEPPPTHVRVDFDWHTGIEPKTTQAVRLMFNDVGVVYGVETTP